jgi:hypothetical protein
VDHLGLGTHHLVALHTAYSAVAILASNTIKHGLQICGQKHRVFDFAPKQNGIFCVVVTPEKNEARILRRSKI